MAVNTGVTEIADSEEEPLTSSPAAVSDATVDKLSVTACQDAQAAACPNQEPVESFAYEASSRTDRLDVDLEEHLSNVETTHIDQLDLQPVQQTETNNTCTCTTHSQVQADVPLPQLGRAAFSAEHQVSCIDVHRAGGVKNTLQDIECAPEIENVMQLAERTSTSTNTQNKTSDSQDGEQQPSLRRHLPVNSGHAVVKQLDSSRERSQDEALGKHTATLELSYDDPARLNSNRQDAIQHDLILKASELQGVADGVALEPQRDTVLGSSVEPPESTATYPSGVPLDAKHISPHATDAWDSTKLDSSQAFTNPAVSHTNSVQHAPIAALPDVHDGCSTMGTSNPTQFTKAEPASASLAGGGPTTNTNDHGFNDNSSPPNGSAAQSTATDAYGLHTDRPASNDVAVGAEAQGSTMSEDAVTHVPAVPPAEQSPEGGLVPTESVKALEEQAPEFPAQTTSEATQSIHKDGATTEDNSNLAFTAPEARTQSQSTASQASEPTPPRPAAKLTPQEITLAELKAQKAALLASLAALPVIQVLIEENQSSDIDMSDDDEITEADVTAAANRMVKEHIKLLHEYNELKDVGQGLMGLIADQRGVRIVEVQDEFGIDAND